MKDFEPARIVDQIKPLKELMEARRKLTELKTKVDLAPNLENHLQELLSDPDKLKKAGRRRRARRPRDPQPIRSTEHHEQRRTTTSRAGPGRRRRLRKRASWSSASRRPRWSANEAKDVIDTLVKQAMQGVVKWDRNVTRSITQGIQQIDAAISRQLAEVMHHEKFRALEGTWRGLQTLVFGTNTGKDIKIKVLNCSKRELFKDLSSAVEFDQSHLFKHIYTSEYDMPGGQPYGIMIGDYEFSNHPEDVELLGKVSGVAAGAFCPFISAAAPELFGFKNWEDLPKVRALGDIFESDRYAKWRSFRDAPDSRFVVLTMPRVLARLPYGDLTKKVDEFRYEEVAARAQRRADQGPGGPVLLDELVLRLRHFDDRLLQLLRLVHADPRSGQRGQGLRPADLRLHQRRRRRGHAMPHGSGHHRSPRGRAFRSGLSAGLPLQADRLRGVLRRRTAQKAKKYEGPDGVQATENAAISARLPYVMATSRIAHYLKVMARDKIGSFMERPDCERWLNTWINNYVLADPHASESDKAKLPLADAQHRRQRSARRTGPLQRRRLSCAPGCSWRP